MFTLACCSHLELDLVVHLLHVVDHQRVEPPDAHHCEDRVRREEELVLAADGAVRAVDACRAGEGRLRARALGAGGRGRSGAMGARRAGAPRGAVRKRVWPGRTTTCSSNVGTLEISISPPGGSEARTSGQGFASSRVASRSASSQGPVEAGGGAGGASGFGGASGGAGGRDAHSPACSCATSSGCSSSVSLRYSTRRRNARGTTRVSLASSSGLSPPSGWSKKLHSPFSSSSCGAPEAADRSGPLKSAPRGGCGDCAPKG